MENIFETTETVDLDGDGVADGIADITLTDLDGDGTYDVMTVGIDLDGDGVHDLISAFAPYDLDGDGVADGIMAALDLDGDGVVDINGTLDVADDGSIVFQTDVTFGSEASDASDGQDGSDTVDIDPDADTASEDVESDDDSDKIDYDDYEGVTVGYEQFDASETDMSQVVGDPVGDETAWEYQVESGPCAIYAQCMAYENITGEEVDIEAVIETATEEGWYDPSCGTTIEDMDKVLDYLGLESDVEYDGTLDDLRECLENDGVVVVAVDADEIWSGDPDLYLPNEPNHAIEVIGIDYSGDEPMVIVNDSGVIDGSAVTVPASTFMDAWEDSGYAYVEVYA